MDEFELTATNTMTNTDPSQYNFYNKLSWNDYKPSIIFFITISTILFLSLLFIPITWNIYILRALLTVACFAAAFFIPIFIKLKKIASRGTPYTSVGIDFNRSEIIFKNKTKELYSYSPEKIQSLDIMEISKDASLWTINKNVHFKVPHELHMPHLLNSTEIVIGRRDNRFIIKMIAHLFVIGKDVQISGYHWKIKNILSPEKIQIDDDEQTQKVYVANESTGEGIYKFGIVLCMVTLLGFLYFEDLYISLILLFTSFYFLYILINNPSFLITDLTTFKEIPILPALLEAVKKNNPTTAHILTIPSCIAYPHNKKNKKEVERVLVLTKDENIMIYTASGHNLLE